MMNEWNQKFHLIEVGPFFITTFMLPNEIISQLMPLIFWIYKKMEKIMLFFLFISKVD